MGGLTRNFFFFLFRPGLHGPPTQLLILVRRLNSLPPRDRGSIFLETAPAIPHLPSTQPLGPSLVFFRTPPKVLFPTGGVQSARFVNCTLFGAACVCFFGVPDGPFPILTHFSLKTCRFIWLMCYALCPAVTTKPPPAGLYRSSYPAFVFFLSRLPNFRAAVSQSPFLSPFFPFAVHAREGGGSGLPGLGHATDSSPFVSPAVPLLHSLVVSFSRDTLGSQEVFFFLFALAVFFRSCPPFFDTY